MMCSCLAGQSVRRRMKLKDALRKDGLKKKKSQVRFCIIKQKWICTHWEEKKNYRDATILHVLFSNKLQIEGVVLDNLEIEPLDKQE